MKTGKQTVDIDGDSFSFKFKDSTASKGAGIHGEDDDKLYAGGKLLEADKDEKYQVVLYVDFKGTDEIYMNKLDVEDFLDDFCKPGVETDNGKKESEVGDKFEADAITYELLDKDGLAAAINNLRSEDEVGSDSNVEVTGTGEKAEYSNADVKFYLVNTSGSTVKKKSAAKDGSDYKFEVENYDVKSVSYDID